MRDNAINIWENTGCKARVRMTVYRAADTGAPAPACIVCPGGSYFWLGTKGEGHAVARWLNTHGIAAFVLEYRVGGIPAFIMRHRLVTRGNRWPDMLLDAQRAIEIVRTGCREYNVDPGRIGVLGFSAGGHLALMTATMFDSGVFEQHVGRESLCRLRPDFIAPIYPVVSMTAPCAHSRSRRGLIGESFSVNRGLRDRLSMEKSARSDMPPVFFINCEDDPVVDYHNSRLLDIALTRMDVPHRYIPYSTGGHGFGVNAAAGTDAAGWRDSFIQWLNESGIL